MECFLSKLQRQSIKRKQEDRIVWKRGNKGVFFLQLYSLLETDGTIPFPLKIVQNPWIPSKVNFFSWEACWGKVLTLDQLKKKSWILANKYALCKEESEFIDPFFIVTRRDYYGSQCYLFLVFDGLFLSQLRRPSQGDMVLLQREVILGLGELLLAFSRQSGKKEI